MSEKNYNTPSMIRARIAAMNKQTRKVNQMIALLHKEEAAVQKLKEAHKRLQVFLDTSFNEG